MCVAAIGLEDVAALQLAQPSLGKMAVKEPAQPFWCHIPRLALTMSGVPSRRRSQASAQCSNFTGMRPVFGDILINFEVVWYSGMRKWYAEC